MTIEDIAAATRRVESLLERRPASALHDDPSATARWQSGVRVAVEHGNGTQVVTDLPTELGGSGDKVTPGWLFRAGLASCLTTSIAWSAAAEGIALSMLEVLATSRSDLRGLFGMLDGAGNRVGAGPLTIQLQVRIAANGVAASRLQALVEKSSSCSHVSAAVRDGVPIHVSVQVDEA